MDTGRVAGMHRGRHAQRQAGKSRLQSVGRLSGAGIEKVWWASRHVGK